MIREKRAVTFDCWSTLIYERDPGVAFARRLDALARTAGVGPVPARAALEAAWRRHFALWQQGEASGGREIAAWALESLGGNSADLPELARVFEEASLGSEIVALEGARDLLVCLADAGVRRALVCDTGFSPGRVVRELLARAGVLDWLEVAIFSDEAGVPKPHPRVFEAALAPLGVAAHEAVHVGDLRRTDVAGSRAAGLTSVRLRWHHDDVSDLPEADLVADSHVHLRELFGLRSAS